MVGPTSIIPGLLQAWGCKKLPDGMGPATFTQVIAMLIQVSAGRSWIMAETHLVRHSGFITGKRQQCLVDSKSTKLTHFVSSFGCTPVGDECQTFAGLVSPCMLNICDSATQYFLCHCHVLGPAVHWVSLSQLMPSVKNHRASVKASGQE